VPRLSKGLIAQPGLGGMWTGEWLRGALARRILPGRSPTAGQVFTIGSIARWPIRR
jgi:hypothetical protein